MLIWSETGNNESVKRSCSVKNKPEDQFPMLPVAQCGLLHAVVAIEPIPQYTLGTVSNLDSCLWLAPERETQMNQFDVSGQSAPRSRNIHFRQLSRWNSGARQFWVLTVLLAASANRTFCPVSKLVRPRCWWTEKRMFDDVCFATFFGTRKACVWDDTDIK